MSNSTLDEKIFHHSVKYASSETKTFLDNKKQVNFSEIKDTRDNQISFLISYT